MWKATRSPKRKCRSSNWKTERALPCVHPGQSPKSSITCLRNTGRRKAHSVPQNSSKSKRKSEEDSIGSGTGCKRMRGRVSTNHAREFVRENIANLTMDGSDYK